MTFNNLMRGLLAALAIASMPAIGDEASDDDRLFLYVGSFTHFSSSEDHDGVPIFGGAEWVRPDDWLYGVTLANNSFDQFTQYVYVGKRFDLPWYGLHAKVTGGLLHGYKAPFDGKIPFNGLGIAPAIVPSLGKDVGEFEFNVGLLGGAGILFSVGYNIFDATD